MGLPGLHELRQAQQRVQVQRQGVQPGQLRSLGRVRAGRLRQRRRACTHTRGELRRVVSAELQRAA